MEVRFTARFNRDLAQLQDPQLSLRLERVIVRLEVAPRLSEVTGVRRLTGQASRYRIRIGSYRLIFLVQENIAYLETFAHRKEAYRRLGRG